MQLPKTATAKLFRNGASRAVRPPAEFGLKGTEVHIFRDEATGNVVLPERPGANPWAEFFAGRPTGPEVDEYLSERPMNRIPVERDIFGLDEEV